MFWRPFPARSFQKAAWDRPERCRSAIGVCQCPHRTRRRSRARPFPLRTGIATVTRRWVDAVAGTKDGVAVFAVNRECFPNDFAGGGVERDKAPVERPHKDFPLPRGHATIHHIAARVDGPLGRHFGIIGPELFSRGRFYGDDFAPGGRKIHDTVDNNGRGFLAAVSVKIERPGQAEPADVLVIDLIERTEALLAISAAVGHPVAGLVVGVDDARSVNAGRRQWPSRRWSGGFLFASGAAQQRDGKGKA